MGKFEAEAVLIRRLADLTITFYSSDTIYVATRASKTFTVFHKWFAPRGSYNGAWRDFRRQLLRQKRLTLVHCYELAERYGILYTCTARAPKLDQKKIKFRDY